MITPVVIELGSSFLFKLKLDIDLCGADAHRLIPDTLEYFLYVQNCINSSLCILGDHQLTF